MLKVSNIDVAYGDVQVLWDVSFEVREKEILVLVGANGAGKSTTLRTISGLLHPLKGSIEFKGARLDQIPDYRIIDQGIAHVPEGRRLFPEMTVEENLIMGSLKSQAKVKRQQTLRMGLYPFSHTPGASQATGANLERRRAANVRHRPGINVPAGNPDVR